MIFLYKIIDFLLKLFNVEGNILIGASWNDTEQSKIKELGFINNKFISQSTYLELTIKKYWNEDVPGSTERKRKTINIIININSISTIIYNRDIFFFCN